jgi:predicted Zn-dependent protease
MSMLRVSKVAVLVATVSMVAGIVSLGSVDAAAEGVKIGKRSMFRNLVPAAQVEQQSAVQYDQMRRDAFQKKALLGDNNPHVQRVRRIARDLLPNVDIFNEASKNWKWEVSVFQSDQINAFCMPGGKIAFFTGILEKLNLTDDEVAMIMGHEMGHALWEHARERTAKTNITGIGGRLIGGLLFGQAGEMIGAAGSSLAALKFSRNDETEADLIGMELAARAGYDPRSGVTLWQKMSAASKGAPPQWLSTHPAGTTRIKTIEKNLPDVMPLYQRAIAERRKAR